MKLKSQSPPFFFLFWLHNGVYPHPSSPGSQRLSFRRRNDIDTGRWSGTAARRSRLGRIRAPSLFAAPQRLPFILTLPQWNPIWSLLPTSSSRGFSWYISNYIDLWEIARCTRHECHQTTGGPSVATTDPLPKSFDHRQCSCSAT